MPRNKRTKQEDVEESAAAASSKRPKRGQAAASTAKVEEAAAVAAASAAAAAEPSIEEAAAKAAVEAVEQTAKAATAAAAAAATRGGATKKGATKSAKKETPPAADAYQGCPPNLSPLDPANFDHFLVQLLSFKADTNNYHVPKDDFPELHTWLQFLKREYKAHCILQGEEQEGDDDDDDDEAAKAAAPEGPTTCSLTAEQLKILHSLHVPLTSRGDDHWNRFYQLLLDYKERHGHVLVPRLCEIPGLGDWVTDQRRQYKSWKQGGSTQLTADRRTKLQELGFVWQVRNRPEWDQRFSELIAYKEKHGDCKVPQHYKENKALGKWVAKQREQYKLLKKNQHSFLTPYRMEKLNSAGFVWQVRATMDADDIAAAGAPTPGKAAAAEAVETPSAKAEAEVEAAAKEAVEAAHAADDDDEEEAETPAAVDTAVV